CFPIEPVPFSQQLFAAAQLGLPLLPPVGAQPARHDNADQRDQPEPESKPSCSRRISHSFQSARSAANGSTRAALRAGRYPATPATASNTSAASTIVTGPFGSSPNSKLSTNRVVASAAPSPEATPNATHSSVWRKTNRTTRSALAPSAIRIPISCARRATS